MDRGSVGTSTVSLCASVLFNPMEGFLLHTSVVSLYTHADPHHLPYYRGFLYSSLGLHSAAFSSVLRCSGHCGHLVLPWLLGLSPQLRQSSEHLLDSPTLCHSLETLKTGNWGNSGSHFSLFLTLSVHCPLFPIFQCQKKIIILDTLSTFWWLWVRE